MIYRQFSITLAAAMLLSLFVAMTITPAMCAVLLNIIKKPKWGQMLELALQKVRSAFSFLSVFNQVQSIFQSIGCGHRGYSIYNLPQFTYKLYSK